MRPRDWRKQHPSEGTKASVSSYTQLAPFMLHTWLRTPGPAAMTVPSGTLPLATSGRMTPPLVFCRFATSRSDVSRKRASLGAVRKKAQREHSLHCSLKAQDLSGHERIRLRRCECARKLAYPSTHHRTDLHPQS